MMVASTCVEPGRDPVFSNYVNGFPISSIQDYRRFYLPRTFPDQPSNPYCAYSGPITEKSYGPVTCQASAQHSSAALPAFNDTIPFECGRLVTCQKSSQLGGLHMKEASEVLNTFAPLPFDVFDNETWNGMVSQPQYTSNVMEDESLNSFNFEAFHHKHESFQASGDQSSTQFLNDVPGYSYFSAAPTQPLYSETYWTSFDSTTIQPADIWTTSEFIVAPELCDPTTPDDLEQTTLLRSHTSSSVRVGDYNAIRAEIEKRIKLIQRTPAKAVATIIIDAIDPDKSKVHPYTIKAQVMPPPPYWAADVSHNTPAHLSGDAPLNLLLHFFLMPQDAPEKYQTLLKSITCRDCRWCTEQHATLYACMLCVVQKSKLNLHDNARRDVGPEANQAGRHWPRLHVLMSILNIMQEVEKLARCEIDRDAEIILPEFSREVLLKHGCRKSIKRKKVVPPRPNPRRPLASRTSVATVVEKMAPETSSPSVKRIKTSSADLPMLPTKQQIECASQTEERFEPGSICASFKKTENMDDVVNAGDATLHPCSDWPQFLENDDGMDVMPYLSFSL